MLTWSFSQSRIAAMKNCVGVESRGRGAGPVLPWHTLRPPPFPTPSQAWGTYVVCGCCQAGTTARANTLTQIVPNSSSLYTLFYSVIYNSVHIMIFRQSEQWQRYATHKTARRHHVEVPVFFSIKILGACLIEAVDL